MTTFMKNPLLSLLVASLLIFNMACAERDKTPDSCTGVEFEYEGHLGPDHWDELCLQSECGGTQQSPINITGGVDDAALTDIPQTYVATATHIVNKGHTIQFNFDGGSSIVVDGLTYNLLQFHTHTHSEHAINGTHAPLEMHFVHQNESTGKLAGLGNGFGALVGQDRKTVGGVGRGAILDFPHGERNRQGTSLRTGQQVEGVADFLPFETGARWQQAVPLLQQIGTGDRIERRQEIIHEPHATVFSLLRVVILMNLAIGAEVVHFSGECR